MTRRTGRPSLPYIRANLKLSLPATTVAEVDLLLADPLTKKPKYGARGALIQALLENWLASQSGREQRPVPTLDELRAM